MGSTTSLPMVPRRGLSDGTADLVRTAILRGDVAPGDALREVELAASLGVSRGSVREGFAILEREGLIRRGYHRGTRVIDVTPDDVSEVYAVRSALDRLAALLIRERDDDTLLARLDQTVQDMASAISRHASWSELVDLDFRFHDDVYAGTGNGRLIAAWSGIRSQAYLFQRRRAERADDDYRARIVAEHTELLRAFRSGTREEVGLLAEHHVETARRALLDTE